jgi:hypothetical protein
MQVGNPEYLSSPSHPIEPRVVEITPRFVFPSLSGIVVRLLAAMAIRYLLLGASRTIETIQIFLFTSPSATDADSRIAAALNSAVATLIRSLFVFIVAGLVALVCNRMYIRPTAQGIGVGFAAYGCWLLAAFGLVFWTKTRDMPDVPMVYSILAALAGFGMAKKGSDIFAIAKQYMARSTDNILSRASGSPILYLRSFSTDAASAPEHYTLEKREHRFLTWRVLNSSFWTERRDWTFEEVLCKGFSFLTAVVAIGQPGERLPQLGAARKYVAESEWRQEVIRLMGICRFCCLVVGSSRGLLWEFSQSLARCAPHKILVIVPPGAGWAWSSFVHEASAEGVNVSLPKILPESALCITFADDWTPVIVVGRPLINNYRELALCVAERRWSVNNA